MVREIENDCVEEKETKIRLRHFTTLSSRILSTTTTYSPFNDLISIKGFR